MRIVSQDGCADVDYQHAFFEIIGKEIWCGFSSVIRVSQARRLFAVYCTEEKAKRTMERLHAAYAESLHPKVQVVFPDVKVVPFPVFRFPPDDELD